MTNSAAVDDWPSILSRNLTTAGGLCLARRGGIWFAEGNEWRPGCDWSHPMSFHEETP